MHVALTIDPENNQLAAYITPLEGNTSLWNNQDVSNFFSCSLPTKGDHDVNTDNPEECFWDTLETLTTSENINKLPELCLGGDMRTCLKRIDIEDGTKDSVFKSPSKWYSIWRWNNFRYFRGAIHSYAIYEDCKDADTIAAHAQAMLAPLKAIQD